MYELEDKFKTFHRNNPQVYELFKGFAFQAINKGFRTYSARTLIHLIRWHTSVETVDPEGFKISNNHSPYYSRMFMRDYPLHSDFFKTHDIDCEEVLDNGVLIDVSP